MFAIRTIIALALLAGSAAHGKTLRSSDIYPADYPTVRAVAYMDRLLRERTAGRLGIEQLGQGDGDSENYTIAELKNGTSDMARVNLAVFDGLAASAVVPSLPYVFRSIPHMRRVLDGPIGDKILADLENQDVIGLCFYDMGARSYGATRPIRNVGDMKGLTVAVQKADNWTALVQAMAAKPATMPLARRQLALRTGTIDAVENTLPGYVVAQHHAVARFYSLTEHTMSPGVLVFSKRVWDKLAPEDQKLLRAAAKESVTYLRKEWDERVVLARLAAPRSSSTSTRNRSPMS